MTRILSATSVITLLLAGLCAAQDKTADEQFHAIATSRSKAELSLRKLKTFFEQNEMRWRLVQSSPDGFVKRIYDTIRKTTEEEQRKPEDVRNVAIVEELNQRRALVEQDWNRYVTTERGALETTYRQSQQQMDRLWQTWTTLTTNETNWKDLRLDQAALQASYDAVAKRADELRAATEKLIADSENWKKIWELAAESSTRPVFPK